MRHLPFFAAVIALTWFVRDVPFFWDTVQLGSKHAHHFFENGLRWSPLPPEIDSGHPPVFGFYLAYVWAVFGKSLVVSHLAMLPFLLGIVWLLVGFGGQMGGEKHWFWLPLLALADPVLAGQMALVSPDVPLVFFFLLAVAGIFSEKRGWLAVGILGLCLISMRGMMVAGALLFWVLSFEFRVRRAMPHASSLIPFLPGFAAAAAFLFWHWQATGWVGHHPGSSWAPAFEQVDFQGFLRNVAVVGWRWLDFGRVGEWVVVAILLLARRGKDWNADDTDGADLRGFFVFFKHRGTKGQKSSSSENPRKSAPSATSAFQFLPHLALWLVLLFFLTPSALVYQNLSAHRYFLPVFLAFHFVVFQWVVSGRFSDLKKHLLLAALVASLVAGNFWRYPVGISMGWDSTLAHLPYHDLRREMLDYLDAERIDLQTVGTAFPNINSLENTDLNGDRRSFAEADFDRSEFILWSNVFNDFSRADFERLETEWQPVKKLERGGVRLFLYRFSK